VSKLGESVPDEIESEDKVATLELMTSENVAVDVPPVLVAVIV
jgi:hypothetical protein